MNCPKAEKEGIETLHAAYDPMIKDIDTIIANLKNRGVDPTKYYDPLEDETIDFVAFRTDLVANRDANISKLKKKIKKDCPSDTEEYLQVVVDFAIIYFTKGLSLVLPKHMTHVDVKEILNGRPLGGDNSIFNVIKDEIFAAAGFGKNNDLRKAIEDPGEAAKDLGGAIADVFGW